MNNKRFCSCLPACVQFSALNLDLNKIWATPTCLFTNRISAGLIISATELLRESVFIVVNKKLPYGHCNLH